MIDLATLVDYFEEAEEASRDSRLIAEQCRDYYDNIQLTAAEKAELKRRGQPEIVFNRIQPKVDFLLGAEEKARTDPKAYPRTPKHDEGANAVSDAIRYALDSNEFDSLASDCFPELTIEGTEAGSVEVEERRGEIEVSIKQVRWDRFFHDPHSMARDFSDAAYLGSVVWMDLTDAQRRWPKVADQITAEWAKASETFDDKPIYWFDKKRKRVMFVDLCFKHEGQWHYAIYTKGVWLEEPKVSPYVDEDGIPQCKYVAMSHKVKRNGQRYGIVESLVPIQDEINKRRSKALHIQMSRQTFSKQGRLEDVNAFKREAQKPDGHLEFPMEGEFGKDFGFVPNNGMDAAQFSMYQEAGQQMDAVSANAALAGKTEGSQSGRALQQMQQGGMIELGPLFGAHARWKKAVYRQVWWRIKQFWKAEKWVRVTDDEDNLRFVGLNVPVSLAEANIMQQTGMKLADLRERFGAEIQQIHQLRPDLAQPAMVENAVVEMDVDIILEEVPDIVNLQSEQFEQLVRMYEVNPNGIPWEEVVGMSTLRNKARLLGKEMTPEQEQAQAQAQQMQERALQLEEGERTAEMLLKHATAGLQQARAEETQIKTLALLLRPDPRPQQVS